MSLVTLDNFLDNCNILWSAAAATLMGNSAKGQPESGDHFSRIVYHSRTKALKAFFVNISSCEAAHD